MKFGFIGTGNMGGALVRALIKTIPGEDVILADYDPAKAEALAAQVGAQAADNDFVASHCDYIFLGVKPQVQPQVLRGLSDVLAARQTPAVLVSMAAGVPVAQVQQNAGADYPVIRIMPNTPAAVGAGMILYCCSDSVQPQQLQVFLQAMAGAGRFDQLPEGLIDAGSAVSGCGPAFACLFLEALADGGVACGLPRPKAMEYAAQTMLGTAQLLLSQQKHPGVLKDEVCSPGGTTIAGVQALEEGGLRAAAMKAVRAAYEKTLQLK